MTIAIHSTDESREHSRRGRRPHGAAASAPATTLPHRPGIDGLRAVAVMAVVAFHTGVLPGGWVGVDVFFALSGWLITGLLLAEHRRTGRIALGGFWRRRCRRLLPAVTVLLAAVAVAGVAGWFEVRARGVAGAVTYSTNWLNIVGGGGYWDQFAAPDPLEHLWSLAVEEQIYFVWPVVAALVLWASRGRTAAVRIVAAVAAMASIAVAVHGVAAGWSVDRLYQGTDTRTLAFALGAAAAGRTVTGFAARAAGVGCVAAILAVVALGNRGVDAVAQPAVMAAISLCGLAAVVSAASVRGGVLCWAPLRRIGAWSYGIYLFHWPATVALTPHLHGWALTAGVTAASVVLAACSYRLVEQPVRQRGLHGWRIPVAVGAAISAVGVALLVAVPTTPAGVASGPVGVPEWAATAAIDTPTGVTTAPGQPTDDQQPMRVLVLGDNVPALASEEITAAGTAAGSVVAVDARPACMPSPHVGDQIAVDQCGDYIDSIPATIERLDPDIILWWWGGTGDSGSWDGQGYKNCSPTGTSATNLQIDWARTLAAGRQLVAVAPTPRPDLDDTAAAGTACQAASLELTGINVIRLDALACDSYPTDCQRIPRIDGLHYTPDGAITAATEVFRQLTAAQSPGTGTAPTVTTPTRVLVVGDSVAYGIRSELEAAATAAGFEARTLTAPGCVPSADARDHDNEWTVSLCEEIYEVIPAAVASYQPTDVAFWFGAVWNPASVGGADVDICTDTGGAQVAARTIAYIERLTTNAPTAAVTIVIPNKPGSRQFDTDQLDDRNASTCYLAMYNAVAERVGASLWRLDQSICAADSDSGCADVGRRDGVHYDLDVAPEIARRFVERFS